MSLAVLGRHLVVRYVRDTTTRGAHHFFRFLVEDARDGETGKILKLLDCFGEMFMCDETAGFGVRCLKVAKSLQIALYLYMTREMSA